MKRPLLLCAGLLAAALLSSACGTAVAAAATVAGKGIPSDQIEQALNRFEDCDQFQQAVQERSEGEIKREYEQTLLSRLIRREILRREARQAEIEVTGADVDERLDQIRDDFEDEKAFQQELKAQCVTEQEVREFVRDSALEQQLRERATEGVGPTEEELRAEYESRTDDYAEIDVAHILVAKRAEAERIYERLQKTPAKDVDDTFADLAKQFSTDAGSADQGGALGYISPSDVVPEFADAALELEEGEISEPVKTQFGWHIVRLLDTRVRPYEEARDELADELGGEVQESAWQDFLEAAYEEAGVEVNPRFGRLDPDTQLVVNDDADSVPAGQPSPEPTPAADAPSS